jgi:hypothetical protein
VQQVLDAMYIGRYGFAAAVHGMRIWDLILQCAQFDNVDVWEDQGTVYYVAPSLLNRETVNIRYGRDLSIDDGLICSHSLMFLRNVAVEARSYQRRVSQSSAIRVVTNSDGSISVTKVSKVTMSSPQWGTPNIVTTTYFANGTSITERTGSGGKSGSGLPARTIGSARVVCVSGLREPTCAINGHGKAVIGTCGDQERLR